MKKILLALCTVLLVACTDENDYGGSVNGNNVLRARIESTEEIESRVAINGNSVCWEESDYIGVYGNITPNVLFEYKTEQGGVAEFQGNLNLKQENVVVAYYPYQEDAELNNNELTIQLPNEYTYKGNSNAPMLGAKQDDGAFVFKHLCGLMRITLGDLPEDAERFVITSSTVITGKAIVKDVSVDNAILVMDANQMGKTITYHLDNLATNDGLRHFFVPLPVGTYQKIEVSLYGKDKGEPYFTRSVSEIKVERADMIEMPVINGTTGDNYVLNETVTEMAIDVVDEVTLSGENKDVLIYSKNLPSESIPTVGQIIVSKPQTNLPDGFLGRVTKVEVDNEGNYTVHTEMPALTEVFDKLYVDETIPVTFQEGKGVKSRGFLQNGIFKDMEMENEFEISLKYENVAVTGSFEHSGNLIMNIQFDKKNKLEYCAFTWKSDAKLAVKLGVFVESESKIEGLKQVLAELKGVPIPLAGGLVQLFPVYSPYFVLEGKGRIETSMEIEAEFQPVAGALYKDGVWEQGKRSANPKANNESPLNFKTQTEFEGEIFAGISNDFSLRLYNREDMRIYLNPKIGLEVKGELGLGVQIDGGSNLDAIENAKLTTGLYLSGVVGADASLLGPEDLEAELELFKFKFWEKELSAIPYIKDLSSDVKSSENASYASNVKTEMKGEVLSKDMKVELVVVDKEGNEIATSQPVNYNGGKTYEEDPDVIVPLENTFENLQGETDYSVFPRVTSPFFEGIAEGGVVDLKNKSVSFSTYNSIRDVLVKIYNDCGGKNWEHQENWCTDAPVSEWEGVTILEDGTYRFDFLEQQGVKGTLSIVDCNQLILLTGCYEILDKLHIENCPNLMFGYSTDAFPAKEYYLDNMGGVVSSPAVIGEYPPDKNIVFYGTYIESISIKNCKTNLSGVYIYNTPNLKSIVCENISCDDSRIIDGHRIAGEFSIWGLLEENNQLELEKLENIELNYLDNFARIDIRKAQSLKNLGIKFRCESYEGEGAMPLTNINLSSVKTDNLTILCDSPDEYRHLPMNISLHINEGVNIKSIVHVAYCDISYYDYSNGNDTKISKISFETFGKDLKVASFHNCSFYDELSFNGCANLEMLTIKDSSCWKYADVGGTELTAIDIQNTPSLKVFDCDDVNFSRLLFDSHFNNVEATCYSRTLLQEIPDFLDGYNFQHNARYSYDYDRENDVVIVTDNGYGWWYPGEPESGYHGR